MCVCYIYIYDIHIYCFDNKPIILAKYRYIIYMFVYMCFIYMPGAGFKDASLYSHLKTTPGH